MPSRLPLAYQSHIVTVKSYRGFGENFKRVCVSGFRFQVAGYPTDSGGGGQTISNNQLHRITSFRGDGPLPSIELY